jgi:hypothetical protein
VETARSIAALIADGASKKEACAKAGAAYSSFMRWQRQKRDKPSDVERVLGQWIGSAKARLWAIPNALPRLVVGHTTVEAITTGLIEAVEEGACTTLYQALGQEADPISARVVGITDGDTIRVFAPPQLFIKVRVAFIDAPENRRRRLCITKIGC